MRSSAFRPRWSRSTVRARATVAPLDIRQEAPGGLRQQNRRAAGGRAPDGEPSRTPSTKAHQQILDFQKNGGLMIWSPERLFIPPWSLRSPLTAVDPRTAIRGHARQLHIIHMILFHRRRPTKRGWPRLPSPASKGRRHRERSEAIQGNVRRPTFSWIATPL